MSNRRNPKGSNINNSQFVESKTLSGSYTSLLSPIYKCIILLGLHKEIKGNLNSLNYG